MNRSAFLVPIQLTIGASPLTHNTNCPIHKRNSSNLSVTPRFPLTHHKRPKPLLNRQGTQPIRAAAPAPPPPPPSSSDDADESTEGRINAGEEEQQQQQPDEEQQQKEPHKIPQSSIDWNKSWSEFQATGMKSSAPPGREPLSQQEKSRQQVLSTIRDASDSLPSRQQLFSDWRFWLSIILIVSLFTAFVSSTANPSSFV